MSQAVNIPWSGDFIIDETGRTTVVDGDDAYIQRVIRRLLTTPTLYDKLSHKPVVPPDYILSPTFGAGLRRIVDTPRSTDEIVRLITNQILADPETSTMIQPQIAVRVDPDGTAIIAIVTVREPNVTVAFGLSLEA